ncbi:MAG TPA: CehA/McbA family metallohydrolase [Kofleriaceae bacterium]|nr:CehA/McbA family metallohydrolase [Kofleriaceae bacterium]
MLFSRLSCLALAAFCVTASSACGGDDDDDDDDVADDVPVEPGLDDFLPEIPAPTGDAQSVYAGTIDAENAAVELIPGPAASGAVGDLYLRNAAGRFVIQGPSRVIGVIPQGGNLVDAQPVGPDGPIGEDHFGELSAMYLLGRTCEHQSLEVVQDGSGGGVAAVVARGVSGNNDFINIKGIGLLNVTADLDPDIPDSIDCATTYLLGPDSATLEVFWTFYNGGEEEIRGPFAALSDTGGNIEVWGPTRGFERLGIEAIAAGTGPAPVDYAVYQGPGVAYGVVPQHAVAGTTNSSFLIAGVSVVLYGADELLNIVTPDGVYFDAPAQDGVTYAAHVVVGRDASDVEAAVLADAGIATQELAGEVVWDNGDPVAGARVGVFADADGDGAIGADDIVLSYMDTDEEGLFAGEFEPGDYLLRADLPDQARSEVASSADAALQLILDRPVRYDYRVVDDDTGAPIPAKLLVIGDNPVAADPRLHSTYDTFTGIVQMIEGMRGTSSDIGDGADAPIVVAPGTDYRVLVSHGTEWSVAETVLSPLAGDEPAELEFRLRRVVDTSGYVASEYHVHSIGSPDSPVEWPTRVATAVADGVEVFASTEHDYVADLQPIVEELGVERSVRVLPGIEVTPFAFGHFNAWPIEPDLDLPNHGAIDWARGADGFGLTPGEIFSAMRDRGAELVEVNHPRATPTTLTDFQQFFDRAGLSFDYENRVISGDLLEQPVPNDWLRLPPEAPMWDASFNVLEVWNGFATADSDGDGVREIQSLDMVLRDWFNFLSFGMTVTPVGNSDTHTIVRDPMGMPRTMVAVPDDSPDALASGAVVDPLIDNLAGRGETPRDVVVTNGPLIRVTRDGEAGSAIGRTLAAEGGLVDLAVTVQSPSWAEFDVIEVFANATPEIGSPVTSLLPVKCFVTVAPGSLDKNDPCASAPLGVDQIAVDLVDAGAPGFQRYQASVVVSIAADDPIHPDGGSGDDAWVVVRARGKRAIYPMLLNGVMSQANLAVLVGGDPEAIADITLVDGVPASAFTAPIYLDLDGGGYRAPFAPE